MSQRDEGSFSPNYEENDKPFDFFFVLLQREAME
jgi:hypothetical protein